MVELSNLSNRKKPSADSMTMRAGPGTKSYSEVTEKISTGNQNQQSMAVFSVKMFFKTAFSLFLLSVSASYLLTDSFLWGYQSNLTNYRNYIPRKQIELTVSELREYDGRDSAKPLYLSIDGLVYDVSLGAHWYGRHGSYSIFGGRVTDRAFATNCLGQEDQLTNDLRSLNDEELANLNGWKSFFKHHQTYHKVGKLKGPTYDINKSPPPPCKKPKPRPK
ncbi:Cytochrome P450 regulator dap1 [Smittium culicis]|uniref:Cytochrome P450 regulator dap1 n=1 Tax=Smittium culicis TaxID=133412 RepID=A0A1R1XS76_9FUNG|nr:Cytochrome P450 regulator dap1 [Smittium culicis]